jgi:hypothetical protein
MEESTKVIFKPKFRIWFKNVMAYFNMIGKHRCWVAIHYVGNRTTQEDHQMLWCVAHLRDIVSIYWEEIEELLAMQVKGYLWHLSDSSWSIFKPLSRGLFISAGAGKASFSLINSSQIISK